MLQLLVGQQKASPRVSGAQVQQGVLCCVRPGHDRIITRWQVRVLLSIRGASELHGARFPKPGLNQLFCDFRLQLVRICLEHRARTDLATMTSSKAAVTTFSAAVLAVA